MGAEQNIIVAFEFGSSAICGIAGCKKPDGNFKICGVEIERNAESVQRGVVYNIDTTISAITNIVERLNKSLKVRITKAYVGVSGQSLHTVRNVVTRDFETKVKLSNEVMENLMANNCATEYEDYEILAVVPQKFAVDHHSVNNPVGVLADRIEAQYLNIIARKSLSDNIRQCMQKAGLEIANTPLSISPVTLGNILLSDSEKRSGCALVDFGAETTTVSIYTSNVLRNLVVIPLGGNNITLDLVNGKKMYPEIAEAIKKKHGVAYVAAETDKPQIIEIGSERNIDENELQRIIGARQEEIIANVWHYIKEEKDRLFDGVITTGGAAQIKDMTEAIKHHTNFDRVKAAKSLITTMEVAHGVVTPPDVNIDTLIALFVSGTENCVTKNSGIIEHTDDEIEDNKQGDTGKGDENEKPNPRNPKKDSKGNIIKTIGKVGNWLNNLINEEEE